MMFQPLFQHLLYLLCAELCRVIIRNYYQYNCICIFHFCSTTVANAIYTKLNVCVCSTISLYAMEHVTED